MNIDKVIGSNIRKYRTAYNMTLKKLSAELHKSISTVSKYEKGDISLDMPTFMELAHIFNISPSLLLGGERDFATEEITYTANVETFYMYTYDYYNKDIIQSIIERYQATNLGNTYKVQLFNDVKDLLNPGKCSGLYTGEYKKEGFIGTYLLHNQVSHTEHVMISCVNNLVNPNQQLGLVTGLSNYTMLPTTFKTVISSIEMTEKKAIKDLLLFSKEDFQTMKKTHALQIRNSE